MTSIFLFAHQDDEYGIYTMLLNSVSKGENVICVYFTDGGKPKQRNSESLKIMKHIGINEDNVYFVGDILKIPDGRLIDFMSPAFEWLSVLFSSLRNIKSIYIPSWEGGHPDHDALHAITALVCSRARIISRVKQFPLYNSDKCCKPFFKVFHPILHNGDIEKIFIPPSNRLRFLRYCLSYPSQKTTWLGLFPFVLFHYIFFGSQLLQSVSLERIYVRPHSGLLYYEQREFCSWSRMTEAIRELSLAKGMVEYTTKSSPVIESS